MINFINVHIKIQDKKIYKWYENFLFTSMYTATSTAKVQPTVIPKNHQFKNELLAFFSSSKLWSNWSVAKVCAQGLCPPSPKKKHNTIQNNNKIKFKKIHHNFNEQEPNSRILLVIQFYPVVMIKFQIHIKDKIIQMTHHPNFTEINE